MGQHQLVEIAKALSRSAVRPDPGRADRRPLRRESDALAHPPTTCAPRAWPSCYVTHLLAEVERLADAVTVLRDGRVSYHSAAPGRGELVEAIAGAAGAAAGSGSFAGAGAPRLEVDGLTGPGFGPVSLTVGAGEIVGLYGLIGSGRTRLIETLFGRRRRLAGTVRIDGRPVTPRRPADALADGIALVPADRRGQGLFGPLSALDNALLPALRPLARHHVRDRRRRAAAVRRRRHGAAPAAQHPGHAGRRVLRRQPAEAAARPLGQPVPHDERAAARRAHPGRRRRFPPGDLPGRVRAGGRPTVPPCCSPPPTPEEIVALADRALVMHQGVIICELSGAQLTEDALLQATHHPDSAPAATPGHLEAQEIPS